MATAIPSNSRRRPSGRRRQLQSVDEDEVMETDIAALDPLGIFAEINGRLQRENFASPCPLNIVVECEEHRFILYSTALPVQFIAKSRITKDGRVKGMLGVPVIGWYKLASTFGLGLEPPISKPVAIAAVG